MANDMAGFGLVSITERYVTRIASKTYEGGQHVQYAWTSKEILIAFKDYAQTALFKDPVRTAQ